MAFCALKLTGELTGELVDAPELRAKRRSLSVTLHAAITKNGPRTLLLQRSTRCSHLRLSSGDQLEDPPRQRSAGCAAESCAIAPCMDMIMPTSRSDGFSRRSAGRCPHHDGQPGQSLHYTVQVPKDHAPGLYWYHTHPHGESYRQVLDGMSGALVIEGIQAHVPALAGLSRTHLGCARPFHRG